MTAKRTSHTVYDTKYHLVWAPKYRKWVLRGDIQQRVAEVFQETAANHDIEIDTMEIAPDHVHLFVSFPPRESIARVVGKFKSISASIIFGEYPEVKRELWGGHFWQVGYFVGAVGDAVTAEVICRYIEYHQAEERTPKQLKLF
jgi:putative transposase